MTPYDVELLGYTTTHSDCVFCFVKATLATNCVDVECRLHTDNIIYILLQSSGNNRVVRVAFYLNTFKFKD